MGGLSVCTPPHLLPSCREGGVKPQTKFSKRAGLTGPQLLEGGLLGKRGVTFFTKCVCVCVCVGGVHTEFKLGNFN